MNYLVIYRKCPVRYGDTFLEEKVSSGTSLNAGKKLLEEKQINNEQIEIVSVREESD